LGPEHTGEREESGEESSLLVRSARLGQAGIHRGDVYGECSHCDERDWGRFTKSDSEWVAAERVRKE
jgi:hypothetical protein